MEKNGSEALEEKRKKLTNEKQVLFEEAIDYMEAASFSHRKRNQILHQILDEWLYAEKNAIDLELNQKNIYTYCEKRTKNVPKMSTSLKMALLLRVGLLILVVYFVLQFIIQMAGLLDSNIQASSFSFLPIILLGSVGLFGFYLYDKASTKEKAVMWRGIGIVTQLTAFLLFFASMRLWDGILTIRLTLINSTVIAIFMVVFFLVAGKWKDQLEEKELEKDQNDVILFS
ncbi:hypothetical protein [Shouchella lehensis]|uniref:DUF1129 family protein n=1 Tax=Shouchella lehensis TaxID=300825 RepID=A0A4Y7WR71_9BACI|nr:hypothetical protein [Shouchella lehensis]MBG9784004.1 hypothetical protein [Shouchella lehensis]RQW20998.1 hypothetical protein EH196_13105 [Bacillus sp. C1-1]TES51022.1 hypothetical protein E2L03_03620 [Shouchella lehensis]